MSLPRPSRRRRMDASKIEAPPPTQLDVARRAGVSRRTVSNVVTGFPLVADETRSKVMAAVADLGYRPNAAARTLRSGRTGLIGLALPLNVPYFSELTDFVVGEAWRRRLTVVIEKTDGDPDREREFLLRGGHTVLLDGLIFSPSALGQDEIQHLSSQTPVVILGPGPARSLFDRVVVDNVAAARAATEHLLRRRRARIALIGRRLGDREGIAAERARGYEEALTAAGRAVDPRLMRDAGGFARADGERTMEELLRLPEPPDAVFCYNDPIALGAMRAVLRRGLRVPQDVAIAGFDDIEDGRFSTPTLTTIAQDKKAVAGLAVDLLWRRIEGRSGRSRTCVAPWRLEERESTAGPGPGAQAEGGV